MFYSQLFYSILIRLSPFAHLIFILFHPAKLEAIEGRQPVTSNQQPVTSNQLPLHTISRISIQCLDLVVYLQDQR